MPTEIYQVRPMSDADLSIITQQAREINELRLKQLIRDGIGWDHVSNKVVVAKPEDPNGHAV